VTFLKIHPSNSYQLYKYQTILAVNNEFIFLFPYHGRMKNVALWGEYILLTLHSYLICILGLVNTDIEVLVQLCCAIKTYYRILLRL